MAFIFLQISGNLDFFVNSKSYSNILFLELLRIISLALRENAAVFKEDLFSTGILPLPKFFNSLAIYICFSTAYFINKFSFGISLKKTIGKEYLLKL